GSTSYSRKERTCRQPRAWGRKEDSPLRGWDRGGWPQGGGDREGPFTIPKQTPSVKPKIRHPLPARATAGKTTFFMPLWPKSSQLHLVGQAMACRESLAVHGRHIACPTRGHPPHPFILLLDTAFGLSSSAVYN